MYKTNVNEYGNKQPILLLYGDNKIKQKFSNLFNIENWIKNENNATIKGAQYNFQLLDIDNIFLFENIGLKVADYILLLINIKSIEDMKFISSSTFRNYPIDYQHINIIFFDTTIDDETVNTIKDFELDFNYQIKTVDQLLYINDFINKEDSYIQSLKERNFKENLIIDFNLISVKVLNYNLYDYIENNNIKIVNNQSDLKNNKFYVDIIPMNTSTLDFKLFSSLEIMKESNNEMFNILVNNESEKGFHVICSSAVELIYISSILKEHNIDVVDFSFEQNETKVDLKNFSDIIKGYAAKIDKFDIENEITSMFYKTLIYITPNNDIQLKHINVLQYKNIDDFKKNIVLDLNLLKKRFKEQTIKQLKQIESNFELEILNNPITKIEKSYFKSNSKSYLKCIVKCLNGIARLNQETQLGKIVKIKDNSCGKTICELIKDDIATIKIELRTKEINYITSGVIITNIFEKKYQNLINKQVVNNSKSQFLKKYGSYTSLNSIK